MGPQTVVLGGCFHGCRRRCRARAAALAGHGNCWAEVLASIAAESLVPVAEGTVARSLMGTRAHAAFQEWAGRVLQGRVTVFGCGPLLGFERKGDAAVFLLSHWAGAEGGPAGAAP